MSDPGLGAFQALSGANEYPHKAGFSLGQVLAGTVWGIMVASWGSEKSSLGQISLFVGSFSSFCGTLENSFFMFLSHLAAPRGTPGGVRSMFRRVLSSLWSKRICAQGSFSLGPGAGGHRLGPHGGLLRLKKVVFGSQFTFLVSILEFWWHPQKSIFFTFLSLLAAPRGVPGASGRVPGVPQLRKMMKQHVFYLKSQFEAFMVMTPASKSL